MKRINFFAFFLCFFFFSSFLGSNENILSKRNFLINDLSLAYISETGISETEDPVWQEFFVDKSFDDIKSFLSNLPIRNPNPTVQSLIYKILVSKKLFDKKEISKEQDNIIFEEIINQLFNSGRLNEIDLFYSQTLNLQNNEMILTKMIEGNFLRNRHTEACKILENKVKDKPIHFGKIMVICDILNNKYEEARLGLALLKEQNTPGDIFFIELAFSLMSENNISESDYLKKTLDQIKQLNPVVMTSLQFADISPNFEQIENLSTSGLLFILSNPTVETDLKIYCAELLVKQGRISFEMLSEAYQLSRYDNKDIDNALNLYKTLAPVKARPLLYQSILRDENPDSKYLKIRAFLKLSVNEKLFGNISNLIDELMPLDSLNEYIKSKEDVILFSKMFRANKKFYEAKKILSKMENIPEKQIGEVLVDLSQFLSSQNINFSLLEKNLADLAITKDLDSQILNKAILVMLVNMNLNQNLKKTLQSFKILELEKSNSIDLTNLFFAEKFSNEGDYFNSVNIFFSILGDKSFSDLSLIENFAALLILKNLGFNEELRELSEIILL